MGLALRKSQSFPWVAVLWSVGVSRSRCSWVASSCSGRFLRRVVVSFLVLLCLRISLPSPALPLPCALSLSLSLSPPPALSYIPLLRFLSLHAPTAQGGTEWPVAGHEILTQKVLDYGWLNMLLRTLIFASIVVLRYAELTDFVSEVFKGPCQCVHNTLCPQSPTNMIAFDAKHSHISCIAFLLAPSQSFCSAIAGVQDQATVSMG